MASGPVKRRLAAILAADIAGYSRLMGADEEGTLAHLKAHRSELVDPKNKQHRGRIVKTTGDGMLIEFPSVVDAVRCAIEVQQGMLERNAQLPEDKRIEFRVGINLGDVMVEGRDLYGDGVNIAARLEALAEPGGICISETVFNHARDKVAFETEDAGNQSLKNIARPVHVYRIIVDPSARKAAPRTSSGPLAVPDRPSIAVLPFQNMSGDAEQEYFSDGVVEEIITALSRMRWLFVIARNSSFTYKGRPVDVKQVGRELGVRYVLEGSVRRGGNRVRITAQLIDAATGKHIWSDRYDGGTEEIFELQDRITESVIGMIQPSILLAEIERTKRKRPESLDAYDYLLQALPHIWALDPAANATALRLLEAAIEIEPNYSWALALAAWCHARKISYNWTFEPEATKAEALRLTRLAGDMNSDDPEVLTMLSAAHSVLDELDLAAALIDKALALNPNSAFAWHRSGWVNVYREKPGIAIEHFGRAIRLSPFDPVNFNCYNGIGAAHFVAERYEEALPWFKKALLERPDLLWSLRGLAASLACLGRMPEAREIGRQILLKFPDITISKTVATIPHSPTLRERYADALAKAGLPE